MNLEVDVMEGDEFTYTLNEGGNSVFQRRGAQVRFVEFRRVCDWIEDNPNPEEESLGVADFTRYCHGCGLTVKEVKPEPQVETIKPPEWAVVTRDGVVVECESKKARDALMAKYPHEKYKPVRIDWGAK